MSGAWSPLQRECLDAMGLEVLVTAPRPRGPGADGGEVAIPDALLRAARGIDLAPLIAACGMPRDPVSRRAFWRMLRPLRRTARP